MMIAITVLRVAFIMAGVASARLCSSAAPAGHKDGRADLGTRGALPVVVRCEC